LLEKKKKKTVRKKRKHPDSEDEAVVADEEATTSEDNEPVKRSYLFRKRKHPDTPYTTGEVDEDVVSVEGELSETYTDSEIGCVERRYELRNRTTGTPQCWLRKKWNIIKRKVIELQDELESDDEAFGLGITNITDDDIEAAKLVIEQWFEIASQQAEESQSQSRPPRQDQETTPAVPQLPQEVRLIMQSSATGGEDNTSSGVTRLTRFATAVLAVAWIVACRRWAGMVGSAVCTGALCANITAVQAFFASRNVQFLPAGFIAALPDFVDYICEDSWPLVAQACRRISITFVIGCSLYMAALWCGLI